MLTEQEKALAKTARYFSSSAGWGTPDDGLFGPGDETAGTRTGGEMGDPRRFHHMAQLIADLVPRAARIADVAAGKGYLRAALHQLGYRRVESWDRRPRCAGGRGYRYGYFQWDIAPRDYDAVIAMHPDAGTDHAVLYAAMRKVPAIVCPCCVQPSAVMYRGRHVFTPWCDHLESLATSRGASVRWVTLPMSGRNRVMVVQPEAVDVVRSAAEHRPA